MGKINMLIIPILIVIIPILTVVALYIYTPQKEIEPIEIITSIELPKEDENTHKAQIVEKVQRYIEKREYEKAILELNRAIELDPEDASLYYILGNIYEQSGKDKESIEAFVKALQLDPEGRKIYQQENKKIMEQGNKKTRE